MIKTYNIFNGLIWMFLIYVVGDIVTTYIALPYGTEANPIISAILNTSGFAGLIMLKLMFVVFAYYAGEYTITAGYTRLWDITIKAVILMGVVIMINNINVYLHGIGMI